MSTDARIHEWIQRLDDCPPDSSDARVVYAEAIAAGLAEQLRAELERQAANEPVFAEMEEAPAARFRVHYWIPGDTARPFADYVNRDETDATVEGLLRLGYRAFAIEVSP